MRQRLVQPAGRIQQRGQLRVRLDGIGIDRDRLPVSGRRIGTAAGLLQSVSEIDLGPLVSGRQLRRPTEVLERLGESFLVRRGKLPISHHP